MALTICPECGHEISTTAEACPSCGYVFSIQRNEVMDSYAEAERTDGPPKWIIIPAIAIVALVLLVVFMMMRNNSETGNKNITVELPKNGIVSNMNTRETSVRTVDSNPPSQINVPSNPTVVNAPSQPVTEVPVSQQNVPSKPAESVSQPEPTKGTVKLDAKVTAKNGSIQTVKNEKFYLLDQDIESILNKADLEPIEGNSLTNSFGLSLMYPQKYSDFSKKALEAIKKHIKYSALTDATGKASIDEVKPDSYYLFGITKSQTGFAVWDSSVTINNGDNILNLAPARFNEIKPNNLSE